MVNNINDLLNKKTQNKEQRDEVQKLHEFLYKEFLKEEIFINLTHGLGKDLKIEIAKKTAIKNEISIICNIHSYGSELNLFELYDFKNEPFGFLTKEEVLKKVKEYYGK